MTVYKHPDVEQIEHFYGELLAQFNRFPSIHDHLAAIAERMWQGVQAGNRAVLKEMSNYHPQYLGSSIDELNNASLDAEDCRTTTASEFGFSPKGWEMVEALQEATYDLNFEVAVDAMLDGNYETFESQLHNHPYLVTSTSSYGHEATLLHYAASNGVELFRQRVPDNLPSMVRLLIDSGADASARMNVYNGHFTTRELLESSTHPAKAAVYDELLSILKKD